MFAMITLKTNALKYKNKDGTMVGIGAVSDNIIVDDALSKTSNNPIQNKAVAEALSNVSEEIVDLNKAAVKSINGAKPDENGNVQVEGGGSGGSESELELIKTITITAEQAGVTEIVENFEVDYSGMVATVRFATTDGKSKYIYALFGRPEAATGTGGQVKPDDVIRQIARKLNGAWDIFCYIGGISSASSPCGQSSAANLYSTSSSTKPGFYKGFSAINYYRLYTFDAAGFPEGTEVKIFGMKE